jgi:hypothetical protein
LATEFDLTRVEDVATPTGIHGLSSSTLTYRSGKVRLSKIGSTTVPPFSHVWDLDGQQVLFSIPIQKFGTHSEGNRWLFWTEMRVGVRRFEGRADNRGQIVLILDRLSKSDVVEGAAAP